jgi:hypothetical protein
MFDPPYFAVHEGQRSDKALARKLRALFHAAARAIEYLPPSFGMATEPESRGRQLAGELRNPIPANTMPRVRTEVALQCLYPDEDATLVDLCTTCGPRW